MLSLDDALVIEADALFRELGGEGVILDLGSGRYFGVDRVGARIWQLLVERRTLRSVHQQLLSEFDVPPETLERDLINFAGELLNRGLAKAT